MRTTTAPFTAWAAALRGGPLLLAALAAPGCTYIGQGKFEELRAGLDEDKDGATFEEDCDDRDPLRSEKQPEIRYDGIDNNCSLEAGSEYDAEDLDVDEDLVPKLTREEYEALPGRQLEFPPGFDGKGADCDDNDPAVKPGPNQAGLDVPYDGVDTDCGQNNDFDDDGDGYTAAFDPNTGDPIRDTDVNDYIERYAIPTSKTEAWGPGGDQEAIPGDCEDTRPDWHPDGDDRSPPADDLPYDGKDYDCDGADEFDLDSDGHLPFGVEVDYGAYLDRYRLPDPGKPFDDCADGPDHEGSPGLSLAEAAMVYTGAGEVWYDGLDEDCLGDNDYDQDVDGYVRTAGDSRAAEEYAARWGYDLGSSFPAGDCDDRDPGLSPGVLDQAWNGVDEDCDGLLDLSRFGFDPPGEALTWVNPSNPELVLLEDRQFLLLTVADEAQVGTTFLDRPGRTIVFDAEARGPAAPLETLETLWMRNLAPVEPDTTLYDRIDVASRDPDPINRDDGGRDADPAAWAVAGAFATSGPNTVDQINMTMVASLDNLQGVDTYTAVIIGRQNSPNPVSGMTDLDVAPLLQADPGFRTGVGVVCMPEFLHAKLGDAVIQALYQTPDTAPFATETCFFPEQPREGAILVEACGGGECRMYELIESPVGFDLIGASLPGEAWVSGDWEDGRTLLVDDTGGAFYRVDGDDTLVPLFAGEAIVDFDLADGGPAGLYAFGMTTDGGLLLENHPAGGGIPRQLEVPADDPTIGDEVPYGVGIEVGHGRIALAVTLRSASSTAGTVGWTFLGLP